MNVLDETSIHQVQPTGAEPFAFDGRMGLA
jgi:hypothetical protein